MLSYLLIRDKKESGPYSLEELKAAGILSTDLVWIAGKSHAWRSADEINELAPFVHDTSAIQNNVSDVLNDSGTRLNESADMKPGSKANEGIEPDHSLDDKIQSFETRGEEKEHPEEESLHTRPANLPVSDKQVNGADVQSKVIKIIIADDHTLFREGVKMVLSRKTDIEIVGEAENGMQLLHLLKHNLPDVILLDIQMPVMDGISALTSIRNTYGDLKVIMLTMYNDHSMVSRLMETGANAYLTKSADAESIYEAIKTSYSNRHYFNEPTNKPLPEKIRSKIETGEKPAAPETAGLNGLADMEAAEIKPSRLTAPKIKKRIIIETCFILLVSLGIMAGLSILRHSNTNPANVILPQKTKQTENITPPAVIPRAAETKAPQPDTVTNMNPAAGDSAGVKTDRELNKNENLTGSPAPPLNVRVDSNKNSVIPGSVKKVLPEAPDKKAMTRKKLKNLVTVYSNTLIYDSLNRISNYVLTVYNQTNYKLDLVNVEVRIFHPDSSLNNTVTLNFKNIPRFSSKVLFLPENSTGVRIQYKIIYVKSKQLEL